MRDPDDKEADRDDAAAKVTIGITSRLRGRAARRAIP